MRQISREDRRYVHELECAALVMDEPGVRRRNGRWQVLRAGRWRDLDPVGANLQTNASAETPRLGSAVAPSLQPESETCSSPAEPLPEGSRRQSLAGREMLVPLWGPAARCRQPSERSGARWWQASSLQETARSGDTADRLSTERLFTERKCAK